MDDKGSSSNLLFSAWHSIGRKIVKMIFGAHQISGRAILAIFAASLATTSLSIAEAASDVAASCESLKTFSLANTVIDSASVAPASKIGAGPGSPATQVPATCRVHATTSHPGANDRIGIDVWLPLEGWNGRFVGVGGGGYAGGSPNAMGGPVSEGYAAATTDTGHPPTMSGGFALDKDGRLNWTLVRDFSYLGLHDMAVVGKSVTAAFYGSAPKYAYWNGCSTGGRQGLAEAQRYPQDYNGILSAAPAINWSRFIPAEFWPALVMLREGNFLPQCKFTAFQTEAVKLCDTIGDSVNDGVIGDPLQCKFDPKSLIGATTPCGTVTAQDAAVVEKILAGPRSASGRFLWYGLTPGTTFSGIAATSTKDGTTTGTPFMIALDHIRLWLLQNSSWDWKTATYEQYDQLFQQSVEEFTDVIGTDDADLSGFKNGGGKLLIWHGLNDQLIFPQGTINYYDRVTQFMGGPEKTRDFARLFLAPGVTHCSGGAGPQPDKPFDALVQWVERGSAPTMLNGVVLDSTGVVAATRPICLYPETAAYKGSGPTTSASSFVCRSTKKK
jgi:hypothetical protein